MAVRTYAPGQIAINVAGFDLQGKNEVSIEPLYDLNTEVADADGGFITVENAAADHVLVTITLDQTAVDNGILTTLYLANTVVPVGVIDLNGNSVFAAAEMKFKRRTTTTYAKDAVTDRVWTMIGRSQVWIDGGN